MTYKKGPLLLLLSLLWYDTSYGFATKEVREVMLTMYIKAASILIITSLSRNRDSILLSYKKGPLLLLLSLLWYDTSYGFATKEITQSCLLCTL